MQIACLLYCWGDEQGRYPSIEELCATAGVTRKAFTRARLEDLLDEHRMRAHLTKLPSAPNLGSLLAIDIDPEHLFVKRLAEGRRKAFDAWETAVEEHGADSADAEQAWKNYSSVDAQWSERAGLVAILRAREHRARTLAGLAAKRDFETEHGGNRRGQRRDQPAEIEV